MNQTSETLLRPAMRYAVLKIMPLVLLSLAFLLPAWCLSPVFLLFSLGLLCCAWYRLLYIRSFKYLVTPELLRFTRGIFFKRTDHLEMYRIKDYIITRSFLQQLCRLMDLTLKSTDAENPVIVLKGIEESDIVDTIRDHVQEARKANPVYEIN